MERLLTPRHPAPGVPTRTLTGRQARASCRRMRFASESTETARRIDGADVWPDRLEEGERAPFALDLPDDVLAHARSEVGRRVGKPPPSLLEEVRRDPLRLLRQLGFVRPRFVERADGFVDLVLLDRFGRLHSFRGRALATGDLLGLLKLPEKNVTVGERLLHDKGIRGVILQRIAERRGFCRALGSMVVARGLNNPAEFPVRGGQPRMRLLSTHAPQLDPKI